MDTINLVTIISVALIGSFGHCIGMCGGFVVAYSSRIDEKSSNKFFFHVVYNLGRISSYAFVGGIFGLIGRAFAFTSKTQGVLYFAVGAFMVLMGLSLMGKIKFLTYIESSFISKPFFKKIYSSLLKSKGFFSFYLLGALNGLVPCGLVYFFATSAAASASFFWGAIIMIIFGISTMPAMMGFGFLVEFLTKGDIRTIMMKVASVVIILYGIYMMYTGYRAAIS